MRKTGMLPAALALNCFFLVPSASADYGYTAVDAIPMAADFTVRVEFDDSGRAQVITDYPFDRTGATEMNLVYTRDGEEAVTLNYRSRTKTTRIGGCHPDIIGSTSDEAAYRAIREGKVILADEVCIGTSHFGHETDWFLYYSLSGQCYTRYAERFLAQSFNAMANGGLEKSVFYTGGKMDSARVLKRIENADMGLIFSRSGEIESGDIVVYGPETAVYSYDPSTGLFDGHTHTELGFDEGDLGIPSPAALGENLSAEVSVPKDVRAVSADRTVFSLTGGLLTGILVGITLYLLFFRKKKSPAGPANAGESTEKAGESTEKAGESKGCGAAKPPEEAYYSAPRTFSSGKS